MTNQSVTSASAATTTTMPTRTPTISTTTSLTFTPDVSIGAPEEAPNATDLLQKAAARDKLATSNSKHLSQLTASELAAACSQPVINSNPTRGPEPIRAAAPAQRAQVASGQPEAASSGAQASSIQWLAAAQQTSQGIGQRMSQASDQLSQSIRQLYASASSITDVPPSYHNIPGIVPYYHGRSIGPPPSYDEVINPYAAPPTYSSLFGQMREARKSSRGLVDLLRRLLIILVSTLGCTILIAFMILIPFTMIIIGAIYIDECHIEHIPAFLLVGGLVWASKNIIHCYGQCKRQQQQESNNPLADLYNGHQQTNLQAEQEQQPPEASRQTASSAVVSINGRRLKSSICESLLNCVLFGWFIAGCVIVFRNYEPDFENSSSVRYCHRTVYMYTFWLITSALISFGLFIGCICCLMVSSAVASRQDDIDLA